LSDRDADTLCGLQDAAGGAAGDRVDPASVSAWFGVMIAPDPAPRQQCGRRAAAPYPASTASAIAPTASEASPTVGGADRCG
jgi:hypothetical protein